MKDVLAMRPIWHQTDERVSAHIFVAALGLLLHRCIERTLRASGCDISSTQAMKILKHGRGLLREEHFEIRIPFSELCPGELPTYRSAPPLAPFGTSAAEAALWEDEIAGPFAEEMERRAVEFGECRFDLARWSPECVTFRSRWVWGIKYWRAQEWLGYFAASIVSCGIGFFIMPLLPLRIVEVTEIAAPFSRPALVGELMRVAEAFSRT